MVVVRDNVPMTPSLASTGVHLLGLPAAPPSVDLALDEPVLKMAQADGGECGEEP